MYMYVKSFIAIYAIQASIFVNLRYLQVKLMKYKENNQKMSNYC